MIVIETEAKSKWCPFARDSAENQGSFNRIEPIERGEDGRYKKSPYGQFVKLAPAGYTSCMCLGSACMAWQWTEDSNPFSVHKSVLSQWLLRGYKVKKELQDDMLEIQMNPELAKGECGLAR